MHYFQVAFGYGATGITGEQCMFLLHGSGSNGKTTLIEALGGVLSEFVRHTPIEILVGGMDCSHGAKASPELVAAVGSRMVFTSESNAGDVLNEGRMKQLTGSGAISVRALYKEPFFFVPTFKIFMDTNHLPAIQGRIIAIWRRIRVVPFTQTFIGCTSDKDLPHKLQSEAEKRVILAWLVAGAQAYYQHGFPYSCIVPDCNCRISATDLYSGFEAFCSAQGRSAPSQTHFGKSLSERNFERKRRQKAFFTKESSLSKV